MSHKYIFDTSAVITYFTGEPGAEIVREILINAEKKQAEVIIPYITLIEFYYINCKRSGEEVANQRYVYLKSLPATFADYINEPYIVESGRIRANYSLSLADAMIAAYAVIENATLVHKDPEYLPLEKEIELKTLPLKI